MTDLERQEAFRADAHSRELAAVRGVAWSGLGPAAFRATSAAERRHERIRQSATLAAWRRSAAGRALSALVEVERHAEAIRAALSRDPGQDVRPRATALADAAQAVLRALG